MRGFHKSLKASQEKMGAALNAAAASASDSINSQLPPGYRLRGASVANASSHEFKYGDRVPTYRGPGQVPEPAHLRRGDDGVAEPETHLLIGVEHADGLCHRSAFVAIRVVSQFGDLKGVRAHTLSASAGDGGEKVGSRITWRATRDLRCAPRPGDVLVLEVYAGWDVTERSNAWERCVARAQCSLSAVAEDGSTQLTLHRRLERGRGTGGLNGGVAGVITLRRVPHTDAGVADALSGVDLGVPLPTRKKRLFLVRHGESAWNEATRNTNLMKMMKFDHPLNAAGVAQCQRLAANGAHAIELATAAAGGRVAGEVWSGRGREGRSRGATGAEVAFASASSQIRDVDGSDVNALLARNMNLGDARVGLGPRGVNVDWSVLRSEEAFMAAARGTADGGGGAFIAGDAPVGGVVLTSAAGDGGRYSAGVATAYVGTSNFGTCEDADYPEWIASYARCKKCFVSPLTRAVQTAAFVVQQLPTRDFAGTTLLRSCREVKGTMGSMDCVGISSGTAIVERCAQKLKELVGSIPGGVADVVMESIERRMDHNDAVGQWWTGREDIDSKEEIDERMTDFFDSMRFDPSDVCVVVTHSLFIREMLGRFVSPAFEAAAPVLARRMREHKLENCGCLGIDVVFDDAGTPAVVDAKLMFGSDFVGGK